MILADLPLSDQLVVLVGGRGTRLGMLAKDTPKPLMPIDGDRVFLDYFLGSAARQGFREILLLAGHFSDQVVARYDNVRVGNARVKVIVEPEPLGTGGAFKAAMDYLAPSFVGANGDTLFDCNIRAVDHELQMDPGMMGCLALREVDDVGRYGSVAFDGRRVSAFREKDTVSPQRRGHINGGIYALRRAAIERLPDGKSSIETDLFPQLAAEGQLGGRTSHGYFLDIGLPETLEIARRDLPAQKRPALFLDRDGVINIDKGHVGHIENFEWIEGIVDVIRAANDAGYAVIVVTNQAGIAKGYYTEGDVLKLHAHVRDTLLGQGAFVDDFYICPYHADAVVARYRIAEHFARKPNPGMIFQAARDHRIDLTRSVLIGDKPSDCEAASAAGVQSHLFPGGNIQAWFAANKIL